MNSQFKKNIRAVSDTLQQVHVRYCSKICGTKGFFLLKSIKKICDA